MPKDPSDIWWYKNWLLDCETASCPTVPLQQKVPRKNKLSSSNRMNEATICLNYNTKGCFCPH